MKIYLSSTKDDLVEHRKKVLEAISRLEHQAVAMEGYTSEDQTPLDKCLADVARCDLYVGVFAWRYGYRPNDEQSITELEYRKAKECKIPTLVFLVEPTHPWPKPLMERGAGEDKLEALKTELQREKLLDFFTTPEDLASKVTAAISKAAPSAGTTAAPQAKPWQIPPCAHDFSDRKTETQMLVAALTSDQTPIAVIHGLAGSGKSELARRIAERLKDAVPDGAFYFDLRGNEAASGDRPTTDAIMRHVILSIDPRAPVGTDPSVLAGQYHSLLAGRKALLLLDNAYDLAQVQPLIPPKPNRLIITSRRMISAVKMPGCRAIALEPFAHEDAADFLRGLHAQVSGHAKAIAELCGNLPLALRLAAAALENAPPHLTVEKYVARLADAAERHEIMRDVNAALDVTCELLDPKLRGCFAALCVFAEGCECDEAGAVWNVKEREAEQIIGKLLEFNLVKWNPARSIYEMHDAIRDYARMKLGPEDEITTRMRHAELAASHARLALQLFQAGGERTEAGLAHWDAKSKDILQALTWAARRLAEDNRVCELASDLAEDSWHLFEVRYATSARLLLVGAGLDAAQRLNDRRRRAVHLRRQGFLLLEAGQSASAQLVLVEALELSRMACDHEGEGITLGYLGRAFCEQGRMDEGLQNLQQILAVAEKRKDKRQIGISLGRLADTHLRRKEFAAAQGYYQRAIAIEEEIGDIGGLAVDHTKLGMILSEAAEKDDAATEFEKAAAAHHQLRHPAEEVKLLVHAANLHRELARPDKAERCFELIATVVEQEYRSSWDNLWNIYQIASSMKLWPLAVRMADAMIRHFPDRHRGWVRKAAALRNADPLNGLTTAVAVLNEGRQYFPKEDIFAYDIACYTALQGDLDGAMASLGDAAEICGSKERIREEAAADEDLKAIRDRLLTW